MASTSHIFSSSSPSVKLRKTLTRSLTRPTHSSLSFRTRSNFNDHTLTRSSLVKAQSQPHDDVSSSSSSAAAAVDLVKDPNALWRRYVDWLYQHKELGLYLDVSRIGFTDEFVEEMEPRFRKAFKDMDELEKGAIANPDEGRMVGHYWLRNTTRKTGYDSA